MSQKASLLYGYLLLKHNRSTHTVIIHAHTHNLKAFDLGQMSLTFRILCKLNHTFTLWLNYLMLRPQMKLSLDMNSINETEALPPSKRHFTNTNKLTVEYGNRGGNRFKTTVRTKQKQKVSYIKLRSSLCTARK